MKYDEPDNTLRLARAVIGWAFAALAVTFLALAAAAQNAGDDVDLLSPEELEELVGPIALYPDDLIAIVLPAATYPLQVVEAARFLDRRAGDPNAAPDDDWDDSIVALLNYPEVVDFLNEDLDWTWSLGEAVLNQRADVLDAVQRFRSRARAAGNLRSDDRLTVVENREVIEIRHVNPEVIYVPYYEPRRVVVYQSAPVIHYYPWAYPVYYYPYPVGHHFDVGFFFGVTSAFVIGWHDHFFHVHHHHHHLHPYFGSYYYDPFYVRRSVSINVNIYRDSYVWAPRVRTVGRPVRFNDGRPVTRTVERRVNDAGTTRTVRSDAGRATRTTERRANTTGTTTDRSTAAGTRTRTTEGSATASGTRSTDRSTAAGTRTNERSGVGAGARPSANGVSGSPGQTRTRESSAGPSTRIAPAVPNAPARAAEPRVAPSLPTAPSTSQQRTRIVEGPSTTQRAPSPPSTTTRRSTTQERPAITSRPQGNANAPSSNARTQTSQPSTPSRSAQPAPRPSAAPSAPSSSSSRTRSDAGNSGSSRTQSSGGASSGTRTRTR